MRNPSKDTEPREQGETQALNGLTVSEKPIDTQAAISKPSVESKAVSDRKADKIALKEQIKEQLEGLIVSSGSEGLNSLESALNGLLDRVVSNVEPRTRIRVAKTLALAMEGKTWGYAMDETGIQWAFIAALRNQNPGFFALIEGVQAIAEQACTRRRLKLADKRAFDGVERVGKGGVTYLEYSDRLAELLIKGDDPGRYNPQATKQAPGSSGGPVAVQININTGPSNSPTIQTSAFTLSNTDNP